MYNQSYSFDIHEHKYIYVKFIFCHCDTLLHTLIVTDPFIIKPHVSHISVTRISSHTDTDWSIDFIAMHKYNWIHAI